MKSVRRGVQKPGALSGNERIEKTLGGAAGRRVFVLPNDSTAISLTTSPLGCCSARDTSIKEPKTGANAQQCVYIVVRRPKVQAGPMAPNDG